MKPRKKPWISLAVFENEDDARTLETFLQLHRLEARTYNDRRLQLALFLCPPHAMFRLQVRLDDFARAMDFLAADAPAQRALQQAIQCPSCGSFRVQYPQMTRKFLLPTIFLHLCIIFRIIGHEAYCEHCHFLWQLRDRKIADPADPLAVNDER